MQHTVSLPNALYRAFLISMFLVHIWETLALLQLTLHQKQKFMRPCHVMPDVRAPVHEQICDTHVFTNKSFLP